MKTADDVYDAMLSRGFTGAMPLARALHVRPRDWVVVGGQRRALRRASRRPDGDAAIERAGATAMSADFVLAGVRHEYRGGCAGAGRRRPDDPERASTSPSWAPTGPASPSC